MTTQDKIRQAIKEAGLTQKGLADLLGIKDPTVNTWVTGKRNPTVTTIKKIAKATGKPLNYFFDNSNHIFGSNNMVGGENNNINSPEFTILSKDVELLKKENELRCKDVELLKKEVENINLRLQLKRGK